MCRSKTQIQNYIRQFTSKSTFPYITYIHVGFYYQNLITFFALDSTNLEFRYPLLSHARIPFYDVRDTGNVVRECFRQPKIWGGEQIVPIVAEQLTMEEICTTIREVTGKDVRFVRLSYEEALLKLHRETVNNLRWYNDTGSIDGRQAEKTKEIWPKMKTFAEWIREIQWLME
jgi:nucleoside-diphosphate-sugar epimerase